MNNFRRVFTYAEHLGLIFPGYVFFTLLGVVFSAFNLVMLIPFLNVLFDQVDASVVLTEPNSKLTLEYGQYLFKSHFLEIIQSQGKEAAVVFICIVIMTSVILTNIFRYIANLLSARLRTDVTRNLRMDLFSTVSKFHIGFFTEKRKGDLISRLTNDIQEIEKTILASIRTMFKEPLTIIVYFIVLFILSVKLTIFTIVVLPVTALFLSFIIKRLKVQALQTQESLGRIVNIFDELLVGIRVIKAFTAREKIENRMKRETRNFRRLHFSMAAKREMSSPVSEIIAIGAVTIILYYGTTLLINAEGAFHPSEFIAYLALYSQIIPPGKAFSQGLSNLPIGLASAHRVFETIDKESLVKSKENAPILESFTSEIKFDDVSFSYNTEPILQNITLVIPKGKMIALVGASGAGKSTLADLIPRFYDPVSGSLTIDGMKLEDLDLNSLRGHMGIVTQESILFNDSVFENISLGKSNATMEEVIEAAKVANAHDFIMAMEEGYDTLIGERGGRLSGGQKQRLSIARAVLKDPSILILDEATSALDSESEQLVQEALTKLMRNRTSIVIAHRLSTIQHADEIVVMDSGRIIEKGTHDKLIQQGGIYKKLSSMQQVFIDAE